ncbi:MAG: hypothetical protein EZS28_054832, partial [Streblomastix strix]
MTQQETPVQSNTGARNGIANWQHRSPSSLEIGKSFDQMQASHWSKSTYHITCQRSTSLKVFTRNLGEMNRSGYMKGKDKVQQIMEKVYKGLEQMRQCWSQKRKRNRVAAAVVVAAVAAVVTTVRKEKKIGLEKEIRQFREPMEMRTGQRTRNAIDKWRKIDKVNLIRNNSLRTNNNPNHNNHKWKRIQKSMKTKH